MHVDMQPCRPRLDADQAALVVKVFRMLADATRVQVLWALADRELSVNDLAEHVGIDGHAHVISPPLAGPAARP